MKLIHFAQGQCIAMALKNLRERDVLIDTTLPVTQAVWWLMASVIVIWIVWGDHQFQITGKYVTFVGPICDSEL